MASTEEITLSVGGMHCAACVARVERALTAAPGVELATVNLATRQARIRYNSRLTTPDALTQVVTDAGYEVEAASKEQRAPKSPEAEVKEFRRRFLLALLLSLPVWLFMIPPVANAIGLDHRTMAFILLIFATPVMFYSGAPFFAGAVERRPAPVHQHGYPGSPGHLRRLLLLRLGHLLSRCRGRSRAQPRRSTTTPR